MAVPTTEITEKSLSGAAALAGKQLHMVGIGGEGMRGLAELLNRHGALVSGSDCLSSPATERLKHLGIPVIMGHRPGHVPAQTDALVISAAIKPDNPEVLEAKKRGIPVVKYAQMLGTCMKGLRAAAVAGTHGKSTTTALIAYILRCAGIDPTFVVGATAEQLGGSAAVGNSDVFVAEACEYDRSFLNLSPKIGVILNIEEDHLDCYKDLGQIEEAFHSFASLVPASGLLVTKEEDRSVKRATQGVEAPKTTFGLSRRAAWQGTNLTSELGRFKFDVLYEGHRYGSFQLRIGGIHNVYNALAAVCVCHQLGVKPEQMAPALLSFSGARRRLTFKASLSGITVMDDYAHHPTEIQVTLKAAREMVQPKRLWCVFEPHQHSRTRFLLKDFAASFGSADFVVVPDIYFVRDSEAERANISSKDLVNHISANGGRAVYLGKFGQIVRHLKSKLEPGDLVITMGAGKVWEIADEIVRWLGSDSQA